MKMKTYRIFNITAGIALMLGASACSSDYLDLEPESSIPYEEAITNEEGATLALYGLCQSMYKQYQGIDDGSVGFNGEPGVSMYYGEIMGGDYVSMYWNNFFGGMDLMNWTIMNSSLYGGAQAAWGYCYGLISQANNIISFAPKMLDDDGNVVEDPDFNFNPVPDVEGTYALRYAQALTMRAHAYIRLMQIYCSRYEDRYDSNNEYQLAVPLRLEYVEPEGDLDKPLAKWNQVMDQIYGDLKQAIALYESCGKKRTYKWEPDIQVAKGLFARAAMINHDWPRAEQMAHEARAGYPLMSMEEYNQGFAIANDEWIWTDASDSMGVYFFSFGAMYACNGTYPCRWAVIGAGGISQDLVNVVSPFDYRLQLYFNPALYIGDKKRYFWNRQQVDTETLDVNSRMADIHDMFVEFAINKYKNVEEFGWNYPYTVQEFPMNTETTSCAANFGAQFKFYSTDAYSSSNFPFMRGAEMLLTEAEAIAMQPGRTADANALLKELVTLRVNQDFAAYQDINDPDKLLAQIKIQRRMELWGEGFNWFDFKRWNQPLVRTAWKEGDVNSGNWPILYSGTFPVDKNRGWRWRIPSTELNYNHAIDYNEAVSGEDD